ncbi:putative retrotransposon hot spot (RHS) protein [Balamuthia mandrillaris]
MSEATFQVKWHGQVVEVKVPRTATVGDLMRHIEALTDVPVDKQKLLGLGPPTKPSSLETPLSSLKLKSPQHPLMLMGIPRREAQELASEELIHMELRREEEERERERRRLEEEARIRREEEERLRHEERVRRLEEQRLQRQQEHERLMQLQREERAQEEERRREMNARNATLTLSRLKCFSSAFADMPQLDYGDKVCLPPSVLEEAVSRQLELPLNFRVSKQPRQQQMEEEGSEVVTSMEAELPPENYTHCGVFNFNATEGQCYLPSTMMQRLELSEGDFVKLELINLPKGTYAQLQPCAANWVDIPMPTREAILEQQLRNYQTLTVGDQVTLAYNGVDYQFNVLKVKPPELPSSSEEEQHMAIENEMNKQEAMDEETKKEAEEDEGKGKEREKKNALSDSDFARKLDQELNAPRSTTAAEKKEWEESIKFPYGNFGISIIDADIAVDVIEPVEPVIPIRTISLTDGPQESTLSPQQFHYYALQVPTQPMIIEVTPKDQCGDPDLYVSNSPSVRRPDQSHYTWKVTTSGGRAMLRLSPEDSKLKKAYVDHGGDGYLYIGVHAYKTAPLVNTLRYTLSCKLETPSSDDGGQRLGRDIQESVSIEGTELCPNCQRRIPSASFTLHTMRCSRENWRCPTCGEVVATKEKEKHVAIAHAKVRCDRCGIELESNKLMQHKEEECQLRLVPCLYCNLKVPLPQRGEHQGMCGNRTMRCNLCMHPFKRNAIKKHLVEQHGIYPDQATEEYFIPL